tara:strand:- start:1625 stop:3529 length:1905 start_codon:yes stop_codon:yes gene_type:complete
MSLKQQLASNTLGHWDFRTGSIADQSGNSNDGTFTNVPYWQTNRFGKSLMFQGTAAVTVADSAELQATNMTVVLFGEFVRQTGDRFFYKRDVGGTHVDFFMTSSQLRVFDGSTTSSLAVSITARSMIAFTLTSGSTPKFYRDGVKVGDGNSALTITADDAAITLCNSSSLGSPVNNAINEIIYFDTELSEQQMSQLYNEWMQEAHLTHIPTATRIPEQTEDIASANLQLKLDMNLSGATVSDVSGNGNDGDITPPVADIEGFFGRACDFDGDSGLVDCGSDTSIDDIWATGGSISIWIKPRSDGGSSIARLADKSNWLLRIDSEVSGFAEMSFTVVWSGADLTRATTNREIALNAWNHVVVTYDASVFSNVPIVYVNGQSVALDSTSTPTDGNTFATDAASNLIIGNNAGETRTFDGAIDQVQLWDTELTAAQVTQLYEQGQKRVDLNYTGEDWSVSTANVTADFLENTGFEITSGTWQVDDSTSAGKQITCVGAGIISVSSQQAFGTWEFELSKDAASNPLIGFVMDSVQAGNAALGYQMTITANEAIFLRRITGGGSTTIFSTATGVIATDEFVRVVITRDSSGSFEVFVNEVSIDTGTDTTLVNSSFLVLELDAGDKVRNFKFYPTIQSPL